ncbi:T9SS type A sorting domain-containing protein [Flammeovirga sp. MY04]|nr:T9SS type A sorting domain-containing protein [Flammeovirga sp. MY04]ANQ52183.2 T9SS type A sorting domain-containing protein [Flammeovirga sp. MY04]
MFINYKTNIVLLVFFSIVLNFSLAQAQTTYYSHPTHQDGNGDFLVLDIDNWNSKADGSGIKPSIINDLENAYLILQEGHEMTLASSIMESSTIEYIHSIELGGTLNIKDDVQLSIANNFYYYGNLNASKNGSSVVFNSKNGSVSIIEGRNSNGSSRSIPFHHLVFDKNGNQVILNDTQLSIIGDFNIKNTVFNPKSGISIEGNFVIDDESSVQSTANNIVLNSNGDQLLQVPFAVDKETGNQKVQLNHLTFSGGGIKTTIGDLFVIGELTVNHDDLGTKVDIGSGDHHINSLRLNYNDTFNTLSALTFNSSVWYAKDGNIHAYNVESDFNTSSFEIGQVTLHLTQGSLNVGNNNDSDLDITFNGDVLINNGNSLIINDDAKMNNPTGTITVSDESRVIVKGDDVPLFSKYDLSKNSHFIYESSNDINIVSSITYGNLSLSNASTKNVTSNTIVQGSLSVINESILTTLTGVEINIYGDLRNNSEDEIGNAGIINAPNATFIFENQDEDQVIETAKGNVAYIVDKLVFTSNTPLTSKRTIAVEHPFHTNNIVINNPNGEVSKRLKVDLKNTDLKVNIGMNQTDYTKLRISSTLPNYLKGNFDDPQSVIEFYANENQTLPAITYGNLWISGSGYKSLIGNIKINGDFLQLNNNASLETNGYQIDIKGDWLFNTNNFPSGMENSTVLFCGDSKQEIQESSFFNLDLKSSGSIDITEEIKVNNTISFDGGIENLPMMVTAYSDIKVLGDWVEENQYSQFQQKYGGVYFESSTQDQSVNQSPISNFSEVFISNTGYKVIFESEICIQNLLYLSTSKGQLDIENDLLLEGDFINAGLGNDFAQNNNAIVYFKGATAQNIQFDDINKSIFQGVQFSGEGVKNFNGASVYTFEKDFDNQGATINAENKEFIVKGDWINNKGTFKSTGQVSLNGSNQFVDPTAFHRLTIDASEVTLNGNISLADDFEMSNSSTLHANGFSIFSSGNWYGLNGTFFHENGTVDFSGGAKNIEEDDTFYNLHLNIDGTSLISLQGGVSDYYVMNDWIQTGGRVDVNNANLHIGGDFKMGLGDMYEVEKLYLMTQDNTKNHVFQMGRQFSNSTVATRNNNTEIIFQPISGATYIMESDLRMEGSTGNLILQSGSLFMEGKSIEMTNGNKQLLIQDGAELYVNAGATLALPNNTSGALVVEKGGHLRVVGDHNNYASVEGYNGNAYTIEINGLLSAKDYIITDISNNGLEFKSGSTLDSEKNLSNGLFINNSGNASITVRSGAQLFETIIENVSFGNGPSNAIINEDTSIGILTFNDAKGSNKMLEIDLANRVEWIGNNGHLWLGINSSDWFDASNWSNAVVPAKDDNAIIKSGTTYDPIVSGNIASIHKIEIEDGATLTLNDKIEIFSGVFIYAGGTIIGGSADSIIVEGDWVNEGDFIHNQSIIRMTSNEAKVHSFVPGNDVYNELIIDAQKGTIVQSDNTLNVNTFFIQSGIYDVTDSDIKVYHLWKQPIGIFEYRKSKVTSIDAKIEGGKFYSLGVENSMDLMGNITVNKNIKLNNATSILNGNDHLIYLLGNLDNSKGGTFTHSGTIIFNGNSQNIYGNASLGNLIFQGTGNKTFHDNVNITANDVTVLNGIGSIYLNELSSLKGTGTFTMTGGNVEVRGIENYPKGFSLYRLTEGTFTYRPLTDIAQEIVNLDYHNLSIYDSKKDLIEDINVAGDLYFDNYGVPATLHVNGFEIALKGNLKVQNSTDIISINWGNGTLRHYGDDWKMPKVLEEVHHLIFEGKGDKTIQNDLLVTGDFIIREEAVGRQGSAGNSAKVTGSLSNSFMLGDGNIYYIFGENNDVLLPSNFNNYHIHKNSTIRLQSATAAETTISTLPTYGHLYVETSGETQIQNSGTLKILGDFEERIKDGYSLNDQSVDIEIGGDLYVSTYLNPSNTISLNSNEVDGEQLINTSSSMVFNHLKLSGQAQKKFEFNSYLVNGDIQIEADVNMNITKDFIFQGNQWNTVDGAQLIATDILTIKNENAITQSINFGNNHRISYLNFEEQSHKDLLNSLNVDYSLFIHLNSGKVDFKDHEHLIGASEISLNGPYDASLSTFILDGGDQIIPDEFVVKELQLINKGTKKIGGDLTVENIIGKNNVAVNASKNALILVKGNFDLSEARFNKSTATVRFDGKEKGKTYSIKNKGSRRIYKVEFNGSNADVNYQMNSDLYTSKGLTVNQGAYLDVNGYTLNIGETTEILDSDNIEFVDIYGTLDVSKGGDLQVNASDTNEDGSTQPKLTVYAEGTIKVVGEIGQLSRVSTVEKATDNHRLLFDVQDGATIHAKYYEFKSLAHNGVQVARNANVDAINNFSEGVFTGISTNNELSKRVYLDIDAEIVNDISNVIFDYSSTPNASDQLYNVSRTDDAGSIINFVGSSGITGSLKGEEFENDPHQRNGGSGLIQWPISNDYVWEGGVSTDWFDGNNWSSGKVPILGVNNVIINSKTSASNFYPSISGNSTAQCKSLIVRGGQLIIDSTIEDALELSGDLSLESGMITVMNSERITVGENYSVSTSANFFPGLGTIDLVKSNGTVVLDQNNSSFHHLSISGDASVSLQSKLSVDGNFQLTSGGGIKLPEGHKVTFKGDVFISENGLFDSSSSGDVYLSGTSTQTLTNTEFRKVHFDGVEYVITDSIIVNGNAYLNSGTIKQLHSDAKYVFNNYVYCQNDHFKFYLNEGGGDVIINSDRWYGYGLSNNIINSEYGSANFIFNTKGNINFYGDHVYFDNFISKVEGNYLNTDMSILGDMDLNVSSLFARTYQIKGSSNGSFILGEHQRLDLEGENNFPVGFNSYTLNKNSSVSYTGYVDQIIRTVENNQPIFYGNIYFDRTSTKKLKHHLIAKGYLRLNESTLNANQQNINIGGNFLYNNSSARFISENSVITFDGEADQNVSLFPTNDNSFYSIVVDKPNGTQVNVSNSDIRIVNDLLIQEGEFQMIDKTATIHRNMLVNNGLILERGNYIMNASGSGAIIRTNGSKFRGLVIEGQTSTIFTLDDNLNISNNYDLNLVKGKLISNTGEITIGNNGHFNIEEGAAYVMLADAKLFMNNNAVINVLGDITILGSDNLPAIISGAEENDYYYFTVDGNIEIQHYSISGLALPGIVIRENAIIDPNDLGYNFSDGTFSNNYRGGVALKIENDQDFIATENLGVYTGGAIENVNFIQSVSNGTANVSKQIATTGQVDFYNARGALSGENYDRDPYNLINWVNPTEFVWTGAEDTNWFNVNNWSPSDQGLPTSSDDVRIPPVTRQPVISDTQIAYANNLIIETAAIVRISSSDGDVDLQIEESLDLSGQLDLGSTDGQVGIKKNWSTNVTGSLKNQGGEVIANGDGAQFIDNAGIDFGKLTIAVTSSTSLQLNGEEKITGDLQVDASASLELVGDNEILDIAGNISVSGEMNTNNNSLVLIEDGVDGNTKTIDISNTSTIQKLQVNSTDMNDTFELSSNLRIEESLAVTSGTLDLKSSELIFGTQPNAQIEINGGHLFIDDTRLLMGDQSKLVMCTGTLTLQNNAIVTRSNPASGGYGFELNGGQLNSSNATFEYMGAEGIVYDGVQINPVNLDVDIEGVPTNFDVLMPFTVYQYGATSGRYVHFKNYTTSGTPTVGNKLLDYKFYHNFFLRGAQYNALNQTASTVYFVDAKGLLKGDNFEEDGDIVWEDTKNVYVWIGSATEDLPGSGHAAWNNKDHWGYFNGTPTPDPANEFPGELADHDDNAIVIVGQPQPGFLPPVLRSSHPTIKIFSLDVLPQAGFVIIGDNTTDDLDVLNPVESDYELIISEEFNIVSDMTGFGYVDFQNSLVGIQGKINNDGIFYPNTSIMVLETPTGNINLTAGENYHSLYIKGQNTSVVNLDGDINVQGNFEMDNGTLNIGGNTFNVGGDFELMAGVTVQYEDDFILNLNGSDQNITLNNQTINHLYFDGTGNKTFQSNIQIAGDLQILGQFVSLNDNGYNLNIGGRWFNEYANGNFTSTGQTTFDGSTPQYINTFNGEEVFNHIIINNSNGLTSLVDLQIKSNLTLTSGLIVVPHMILQDAVGNITSNASSYVVGKVTKQNLSTAFGSYYVFPVGSTTTWARLGLNNVDDDPTDYYVEFKDVDPNAQVVVNDGSEDKTMAISSYVWDVHRVDNGGSYGGITIEMYFEDLSALTLENEGYRTIVHHDESFNPSVWELITSTWSTVGVGGRLLSTIPAEINSFSDFGATLEEYVDPSADLPVELISFTGEIEGDEVTLKWATATEENASHYEIERSVDGRNYETIGEVNAAGNSNTLQNYTFIDVLTSSKGYYRLKQVDFDDDFTYYGPVIIIHPNVSSEIDLSLEAYPNPVDDEDTQLFILGLELGESYVAQIYSITGQLMHEISDDDDKITIPTTDWKTGMYMLKVRTSTGKTAYLKLIRQ